MFRFALALGVLVPTAALAVDIDPPGLRSNGELDCSDISRYQDRIDELFEKQDGAAGLTSAEEQELEERTSADGMCMVVSSGRSVSSAYYCKGPVSDPSILDFCLAHMDPMTYACSKISDSTWKSQCTTNYAGWLKQQVAQAKPLFSRHADSALTKSECSSFTNRYSDNRVAEGVCDALITKNTKVCDAIELPGLDALCDALKARSVDQCSRSSILGKLGISDKDELCYAWITPLQ